MSTQIIAIDGYASTGKSTLAKKLAKSLGYIYMDTGYMFRVLTYEALQRHLFTDSGIAHQALQQFLASSQFEWKDDALAFNGQVYDDAIRTMDVSEKVSFLAADSVVREFTLINQRHLAQGRSIVMDGRDIGTVVFPEAKFKFFLDARPEVRAQRRWEELTQKGEKVTYETILENVLERDRMDSQRTIAPLTKAKDAIVIDTSELNVAEVFEKMHSHIQQF